MKELHYHYASLAWLRWADLNCRPQSMNLVRNRSSTARYTVRGFRALSMGQDVRRYAAGLNSHQPDGTPRRIRTLTNRGPWPRALSVMLWAHMVGRVGLEPTTSSGNGATIRCGTNYALPTHIYVPFQTHPVTPCFTCFLHSVWPAWFLK